MYAKVVQALDRLVGDGQAFENLIHDLIRAEAWVCSIPQDQIDWDHRTNVGDGGRDVVVRVGNRSSRTQFIPASASIWSCKAGQDGLNPNRLRAEVRHHDKVVRHLREGGVYCWCTIAPADNDECRDKLRAAAQELCNELGVQPNQIVVFFRDTLAKWLSLHPGLIPHHLDIKVRWRTLNEWERLFKSPWVDFGNRSELISIIQQHLTGTGEPNVLHIVGLSGIGKTRVALRACQSDRRLEVVQYYPSFSDFREDMDDLIRIEGMCAIVVVDEVSLAEWDSIVTQLADYPERIRVLTIGPAPKGQATGRRGVLEVPPPDGPADVMRVVQVVDPTISDESAQDIAQWSDHDLRLALLLVEAHRRDPSLRDQPITSVEDILQRVAKLFADHLPPIHDLRDYYSILSLCVDIGNRGQHRNELEYVSKYFAKPITALDHFIALACACGLGGQHGSFFEAAPRALSRQVFESIGWPRVRDNVSAFLRDMPTLRLQRRFLERGQECSRLVRDEVTAALREWFRLQFPSTSVELIRARQPSRVFATYAEMDPEEGLRWLRRAVETASAEQLLHFDGEPDGSGGWRGRRQIVWLCEGLASFPEYFRDCEAILFQLARFETEHSIGNNSTHTWRKLFQPIFSGTAVSFDERLQLLETRLAQAAVEDVPLIMGAVTSMLSQHQTGILPPRVVGGRLVPDEWRPKTYEQMYQMQSCAARRVLKVISALPAEQRRVAMGSVAEHIWDFLRLNCIDLLRELFEKGRPAESTIRLLRLRLDELISWLEHTLENQPPSAEKLLEDAREWRRVVEPNTLESRVREVTGRSYWEHKEHESWQERQSVYHVLASEALDDLEILDRLHEWFNGDEPRSSFVFGQALGEVDAQFLASEWMRRQLFLGQCTQLVAGYFKGTFRRLGDLPPEFRDCLDQAAATHPYMTSYVTVHSDYSIAGVNRLLCLLPLAKPRPSSLLIELTGDPWPSLLSDDTKIRFLLAILQLDQDGDDRALQLGITLVSSWERKRTEPLPEQYVDTIIRLIQTSLSKKVLLPAYDSEQVIRLIPDSHIDVKCDMLADLLISREHVNMTDDALRLLKDIAQAFPREVMRALGRRMLDPHQGLAFRVLRLEGLFEAIGLDTVREWLMTAGTRGALSIARHLESPHPTESDPTYVPPLTEWFLSYFEDDDNVFRAFCAGRHDFELRWGPASEFFAGIEERLKPYLKHRLRRVREWAQFELDYARKEVMRDQEIWEDIERE